jgi:hypothetical protein
MGAIGRELIRRSRERIIQLEREIDWMRSRGGYEERIAEHQEYLRREREALEQKIRFEGNEL